MKNKSFKAGAVIATAASVFVMMGLPFFKFIVGGGGSKSEKLVKKKWNNLKHIRINRPRERYEDKFNAGLAWCEQQKMQDCYIRSNDNLLLHARYLKADNAKRYVILCHGYKGKAFNDFANMARFLHENGCNLLFIDQRCCGESQGKYITFGAKEQYDVRRWTYYISHNNNKHLPIYLYGESMGASSVLMASGHTLPDEVKGIIADCGFTSMKVQLCDIAAGWFHLPWIELLLLRVDMFCRLLGRFKMKDADVFGALKKNKRPVLFFHGDLDTYVTAANSKYNYAICTAPKELVIVPGARHISSPYEDEELYRSKVMEFFGKYDG